MPRVMPKKRTPTIAMASAASDGWSAAAEIRYAEVAIRPMPLPIVTTPSSTASAIQFLSGHASLMSCQNVLYVTLVTFIIYLGGPINRGSINRGRGELGPYRFAGISYQHRRSVHR